MKIAVVGSYGAGLTMRVPKAPAAGETVSGGSFAPGPGGKGSNQAVAAARLGAEVALLTAVGDDDFGRAARELWRAEGVGADQVLTATAPTMVGFILVEPSGENRIAIAPGALDELDAAAVERFRAEIAAADILVVSMEIPEEAVAAALRLGRACGTRTLLNPAPARPLPAECWPLIDVITPNQTEAPVLLGLDAAHGLGDDDLVRALRERTGGVAVLTRGGEGALVAEESGVTAVAPCRASAVVDTTGAGDSFTAALAVALAEGLPVTRAAGFAAAAGAHTVSVAGVVPALPTRDQLNALIGNAS
ncbi:MULTISPECIES: ribokinase [Streptomyces]|uniref:Ribokinase n=1 Tax=Streptomyces doudnae TaxID=3075536 RepID=A0ABD5EP81_9ACTN|nr:MULTISPECIES: ribokinase [unclassified Streptomyces]MDT0436502.1 ribokinase [Streptomyces sp. DSM 41981]MYQ67474.1 ribokinase [Streptomyces sp. SID4950]SCE35533.1 ribokinase [Streptomyces sp. SolWspMP-5a-2]